MVGSEGIGHIKTTDGLRRPRTQTAEHSNPQAVVMTYFPKSFCPNRFRRLLKKTKIVFRLRPAGIKSCPGDPGIQIRREVHAERSRPTTFALQVRKRGQLAFSDKGIDEIPRDFVDLDQQNFLSGHPLSLTSAEFRAEQTEKTVLTQARSIWTAPASIGSSEGDALEVPSLCRPWGHAVAVINLPAFEFVEQRFVADIQTPGRLFPIPTRFLEDAEHQFLFRSFGGSCCDVLQRHVVFFRLNDDRSRVALLILE